MIRNIKAIHLHKSLSGYIPLILPVSQFTYITAAQSNSYTQTKIFTKKTQILNLTTPQPCSTKAVQPEADLGILKKVFTKVRFAGHTKARLKASSYFLYEIVADKINYLEFFNEFKLPNTFNSWFLVTELHVWMLLLRAMAEGPEKGEDGRFLRNNIVEAMWADVNTRAKKLGANNPSGTRAQIEILSEQFQAALIAYDEGIMSDDKVLAGALWRRFFESSCEDYAMLEELVLYVRYHVTMLDSLSREDFVNKRKFQWLSLKELKS